MSTSGSKKHKIVLDPKLLFMMIAAVIIALAAVITFISNSGPLGRDLAVNGRIINLERADTPEKRAAGLSNRSGLGINEGMLFIFKAAGRQCMWMKDMHFNLDIIWLDANKTISYIETNVSPETYPDSYCGGGNPAAYVIELNSGMAEAAKLKVGQRLNFD